MTGPLARATATLVRLELRERATAVAAAAGLGAGAAILGPAAAALGLADLVGGLPARAEGLAALLAALLAARGAAPLEPGPGAFVGATPLPPAAAQGARALVAGLVAGAAPAAAFVARLAAGAGAPAVLVALEAARTCGLLAVALLARPLGRLAPTLVLLLALAARGALPAAADPLRLPLAASGAGVGAALLAATAWAALLAAVVALRARRGVDPPPGLGPDVIGDGSPWARVNARTARVLAALLAALVLLDAGPAGADRGAGAASATTRRYRLTFPPALEAEARALTVRADALFDAVALEVGLAPRDGDPPLALTLAGPSPAPGGDVVVLDAGAAPALVRATARRLVPRLGGPGWPAWRGATLALEEGLAQAAACRAAGGDPFWSRFTAAVVHVRRPVDARALLDGEALVRERGAEAVPPLGEAWVEALRRALGDEGPRRVLRALAARAEVGPPPDDGVAAWDAVLGPLGADVAQVEARFLEVVEDTLLGDPRAAIPLPRLRLMEEAQESLELLRLVAIPDVDVPPGWDVECRVLLDDGEAPVAAVRLGPDHKGCHAFAARLPAAAAALGARPRVQLGLRPLDPAARAGTLGGGVIHEDWVDLR